MISGMLRTPAMALWAELGLGLAACSGSAPATIQGTLERHRIEIAPPQSEQIVKLLVREGDAVVTGQLLAELDSGTQSAGREALAAELQRARERLLELQHGARPEELAAAGAKLSAAQAELAQAEKEYQRLRNLGASGQISQSQLDVQLRLRDSAAAGVKAASAELRLLQRGTRTEQLEQARAAVRSAEAQLAQQELVRGRLKLLAPIAGRVEVIPYRVGERPPAGAPVVILLDGGMPYARVYVPEPLRASLPAGAKVTVRVDGVAAPLAGTVRFVAGEASFTPYYSLTQRDRNRLSYLAEIDLPEAAAQSVPVGVPLTVVLAGGG
jgi:HlyD family secretion protein